MFLLCVLAVCLVVGGAGGVASCALVGGAGGAPVFSLVCDFVVFGCVTLDLILLFLALPYLYC